MRQSKSVRLWDDLVGKPVLLAYVVFRDADGVVVTRLRTDVPQLADAYREPMNRAALRKILSTHLNRDIERFVTEHENGKQVWETK